MRIHVSDTYHTYAKRVATETKPEETAQYPHEKDRMKQTTSKSKAKKGKEKRRKINKKQECNKEDGTRGEYPYNTFRLAWTKKTSSAGPIYTPVK